MHKELTKNGLNNEQINFLQRLAKLQQTEDGNAIISEALTSAQAQLSRELILVQQGIRAGARLSNLPREKLIDGFARIMSTYSLIKDTHFSVQNFATLSNTWIHPNTFARSFISAAELDNNQNSMVKVVSEDAMDQFTAIEWDKPVSSAALQHLKKTANLDTVVVDFEDSKSLIELFIDGVEHALSTRNIDGYEKLKISKDLRAPFPPLLLKLTDRNSVNLMADLHKLPFTQKMRIFNNIVAEMDESRQKDYLTELCDLLTVGGEEFLDSILARMQSKYQELNAGAAQRLNVTKKSIESIVHKSYYASTSEILDSVFSYFTDTFQMVLQDGTFMFNQIASWSVNPHLFGMIAVRKFDQDQMRRGPVNSVTTLFGKSPSESPNLVHNIGAPFSSLWIEETRRIARKKLPGSLVVIPSDKSFKVSIAEIMITSIVDELRARGAEESRIKNSENILTSAFPDLQKSKTVADQVKPKQLKNGSTPIVKFPELALESNAKYLTTVFTRRRTELAQTAKQDDAFGSKIATKDFDLNNARALISLQSLPVKHLKKHSSEEGKFLLTAKYVSGIERARQLFNAAENEALRTDLALLLSDNNIAKLVHFSDLADDFSQVRPPKETVKQRQVSPAVIQLLIDADATFLLAAHQENKTVLGKLSQATDQIALIEKSSSSSSLCYLHIDGAIHKNAMLMVKVAER